MTISNKITISKILLGNKTTILIVKERKRSQTYLEKKKNR